ncbi:patatin-like phospholipase family protein [Streptomyces sp. NPDC099050]|uniref:patatin-like phospholipase family protein n=1 Tax=Streptomyces sp. NPDC099050 TaxID=3366100 RepID=UPI0037F71740
MDLDTGAGVERALVLGPGGPVGTAWMAGLADGLRRAGVDLGGADLVVGTSAGAIVGALLATGQDPGRLASLGTRTGPPAPAPAPAPGGGGGSDAARLGAVFAVLGEAGLEPGEARRRVGRIALEHADSASGPDAERTLLAGRAALIGAGGWPERRLLITAVEAATGEPVVWDRTSGVPLVRAVAASSAFPGAEPPVAIAGRRYMDGALRAGTNADLAAGARTLVVVEPMAHLFPREPLDGQPASAGVRTAVTLGPDPDAVRAFGPDLQDLMRWEPAYRAGLAQAGAAAERLRPVWNTGSGTA